MNDLLDSWERAEAALEEANQNFTEEGRQLRIYINNQLADACYKMHEVLKSQGREEEANAAHRKGNEYWGRVVSELDDGKPPPKKFVLK
jgi:exonuclease VII small subunit